MLNRLLSRYKWYRQSKGGIWWLVQTSLPGDDAYWRNTAPDRIERIIDTEDYAKSGNYLLPDPEFYQAIANIAVNGQWKNNFNLRQFLKAAKILRHRGIEDSLIIEMLSELYKASATEKISDSTPQEYQWAEIKELFKKLPL
ncbi:hypothetical protein FD723_40690 (plasmid) [Nostoc sp. C052]|uniref:hypothetical protein n=1 Tax=Nostoc sp. C052 TaxID=2576902 RepID=UPI0015C2F978|nr:hypothetical protein [Nostoc sp. C052]QLE46533.1 hypothetical protein FD723_40690 [Nostoc sp. C052]